MTLAMATVSAHAAGTAGALDTTFGKGGSVTETLVPVANASSLALPEAIQFQSNGDILVMVGVTITGINASITTQVLRFTPAGLLDTTFGNQGIAVLPSSFSGQAMAIDSSDRIVIAGDTVATNDLAALRLSSNGALDNTFGSKGIASTNQNCCATSGALVIEPPTVGAGANGILFCGGLFPTGRRQPSTTVLARWTPAGELDPNFGSGGIEHVVGPGGCAAVAVLSTGEILDVNGLTAQFESNGALESAVRGGIVVATAASTSPQTTAIEPNSDFVVTRPLFVGEESRAHNSSVEVLRFTAAGTTDSTFADPTFHFEGQGGSGIQAVPDAIALEADGDIVIVGGQAMFSQTGATTISGLARLTPNGDLDPTFGSGGIALTPTSGNLAAIDAKGRIVTVGEAGSDTQVVVSRYLSQ